MDYENVKNRIKNWCKALTVGTAFYFAGIGTSEYFHTQIPDKHTIIVPIVSNLTKDLVDFISEYDVKHQEMPVYPDMHGRVLGLSNYYEKRILLDDNVGPTIRRKAAIHEFLHIYSTDKMLGMTEKQVRSNTETIYKILYGD